MPLGTVWGMTGSRAVAVGLAGRVAVGGGGQEGQGVGRSRKLSQPNPRLMVGEAVGGVGSHPNFLLSPLNKRRRDALIWPAGRYIHPTARYL